MKFTLQVNSSPCHSAGSRSAYHFVEAALQQGHQVVRVFFYYDGIYNAVSDAAPPEDEIGIIQSWSDLAEQYGIDLVVCISAAQRRGLLTGEEAQRPNRSGTINALKLKPANRFRISGLGQFVEAALEADRLLIFG